MANTRPQGTSDNDPTVTLDRWQPGDPLTAKHWNQAVDALNDFRGGAGVPSQILPPRRALSTYLWAGDGDPELPLYGNAFQAVVWDGVTIAPDQDAERVWIALPWSLRRSTWEGLTLSVSPDPKNEREVTYSFVEAGWRFAQETNGESFNEFIGPRFSFAGQKPGADTHSHIHAALTNTGLFTDNLKNPQPVVLIDLNTDGRAWMAGPEKP